VQAVDINNGIDNIIFVFNFEKESAFPEIQNFLNKVLLEINNKSSLAISLSECKANIESLGLLYGQAQQALPYRIIKDCNNILEYNMLNGLKPEFSLGKKELANLEQIIQFQNIDKLIEFIDVHFNKESLSKQSIENVQRLYEIIIYKVKAFLPNEILIYNNEKTYDFSSFKTLEEVKYHLKDYIFRVKQFMDKNQKSEKSVIDIAKKYIEENFSKEINMAEIANKVSMNYFYFSKLFKEETQMTFSAYLTALRMEEAKRLLMDPINKINDISIKVGYDNHFHFSRAFKNYTGISPKDYRKLN
jgi:YesN/AraC family two-component response regulator